MNDGAIGAKRELLSRPAEAGQEVEANSIEIAWQEWTNGTITVVTIPVLIK